MVNTAKAASSIRIGLLLLEEGRLSRLEFARVRRRQIEMGESFRLALHRTGIFQDATITRYLAWRYDVEAHIGPLLPDTRFLGVLSVKFARASGILPIESDDLTITLACEDPADLEVVEEVARRTGLRVRIRVAQAEELCVALERYAWCGESLRMVG